MGIWYATREQVKGSLEISHNSYADLLIDSKLEASSRSLEGWLKRRFYPELRSIKKDWPNYQYAFSWQLWLDDDLISLTSVTSGGNAIPVASVIPRRGDDLPEPPYSYLEIDLATAYAFGGGSSFQQSIIITGMFGWNDTQTDRAGGVLAGNVDSSNATLVINPIDGYYPVGVGSLVLIDDERLVLIDRRMSDTGQNLQLSNSASQADTLVSVADGTAYAKDEIILVDAERMRVNDIAGNNLIVSRAWDGSNLADHAAGADVYAMRTFLARRGMLGTSSAAHTVDAPVYVHEFPGLVNELCLAETVVALEQNSSGYARTVGSSSSQREATGAGLEDIRDRAWVAYGRKARKVAI